MECFVLSLVNMMPKKAQSGQRPKGVQIELRNLRYDPTIMTSFGAMLIKAIGTSKTPALYVGTRQLHELSTSAGLTFPNRELVHVQDIIDNSVNLSLEIAAGVRYLATCFQLANTKFLDGHTESYGTVVGLQVRWLNHDELILRPCRRVDSAPDRALDSLLRGQMSYSTG
jgi:hypothetical protein